MFELLKILEEHGFEAYIIGGFVRDYLLNIKSYDIDITTAAKPQEVSNLFQLPSTSDYGCLSFHLEEYRVTITTFRKERDYKKRRPSKVDYITNLEEDLMRRDFTINAICMNSQGNIVDPLNGVYDIENKIIRTIGDTDTKLREDPLRILRAVRLATTCNFDLTNEITDFIRINHSLLNELSYERRKAELTKILHSENACRGLSLLKTLNLLDDLEIDFNENFIYTDDILGCWAQLQFSKNYPFSKKERIEIEEIREIIKKKTIDRMTMFKYGKNINAIAGKILGIPLNDIDKIYLSMPIHNRAELNISGIEIKRILTGETSKIEMVKKDLINNVLSGNLTNSVEHLKEYIIENWK